MPDRSICSPTDPSLVVTVPIRRLSLWYKIFIYNFFPSNNDSNFFFACSLPHLPISGASMPEIRMYCCSLVSNVSPSNTRIASYEETGIRDLRFEESTNEPPASRATVATESVTKRSDFFTFRTIPIYDTPDVEIVVK